jgi:hypothetical protein
MGKPQKNKGKKSVENKGRKMEAEKYFCLNSSA